ncbi:leucyl/phenylalanyl-tRNA--protein transferase [uncultured Sphaerotilus sp.]|uniref:leucyl/phenylalanyl-tRNA--protein transferase n=1 Tax=uncultured Sphaerotilus sp. TaxID=474984 RepID=UPI0030CA4570
MIDWLPDNDDGRAPFPPTSRALGPETDAPGLLCAGGQLSLPRLEQAYRRGIFPWYSPGEPILWWSTAPRMVLQTAQFRLHRSLKKVLRRFVATPGCEVRIDSAFAQVIGHCAGVAREGQNGTWIVPELQQAYHRWHAAGGVHSFETWIDGRLVGGLYGVCIGRMFYGESMFALQTDASKIALSALVAFCRAEGVAWIDCQQQTRHLASLGAAPVERAAFETHIARATALPPPPRWTYDVALWRQLPLDSDPLTGEPA